VDRRPGRDRTQIGYGRNIGRTVLDFQCSAAMINGLLLAKLRGGRTNDEGRREAGLSVFRSSRVNLSTSRIGIWPISIWR
jgi:hypothetical protein